MTAVDVTRWMVGCDQVILAAVKSAIQAAVVMVGQEGGPVYRTGNGKEYHPHNILLCTMVLVHFRNYVLHEERKPFILGMYV